MEKLTPLMAQYWEIKNQHLDKIVLFRMGDFYEMFHEDAKTAAPILNIALTSRNKSQGIDVPMCGVPHHSIGPQINKLLGAGLKVAICDQIEDPKVAKGIVKRAVTRVVTPGMVYDPDTLEARERNFIASLTRGTKERFQICFCELSTGELMGSEELSISEVSQWLDRLNPKELLIEDGLNLPFEFSNVLTKKKRREKEKAWDFLTGYIQETQGADVIQTLRALEPLETRSLKLSSTTLRHLEIFQTNDGSTHGSLFDSLDQTKTPMGGRLFKKRLMFPFVEL
ncbi:MAG: hypothetical protein IT289_04310 [Oligoflexia bacterium]|nr:hypothetical protein [Oligoflexia bacterium]